MGCGAWAVVVLMLILMGFVGFYWWLSSALGCPVGDGGRTGPDRAAKNLEEAVAHLPGVVAAEADFTLGACTWYDSLTVDLTVRADADPEQVAAAVALVAAGMRSPELNPSAVTTAHVHDDVPEQHPGAGPSLRLQEGDPDRAAAAARAWAQLKGRYRGAHVAVEYGRESIGVRLPGSPDPAAVREAFDVLRGLGLTEGADAQLRWYVVVAGQERADSLRERSYFVEGDLPPAEGLAAIEAVAAWSAALGSEVVHRSKAVWSHHEGDESPGLEVGADVDIRTAGRTADELADDLAGRLAGSGAPYRVGVFDVNRLGEAVRASG
jgi:hypothetical protein